MSNDLTLNPIKDLLEKGNYNKRFCEVLGKSANAFVSNLLSLTNTTNLKNCEPISVLSAALTAATLGLSINPNLGQSYIIPYKDFKANKQLAQFQMGYKGFVQLAIRSGKIEQLNVAVLGKSQFISYDPLEDILIKDLSNTGDLTPYAYVGKLKLTNGFTKYLIMTVDELTNHAKAYSKSYSSKDPLWKSNFDAMAKKTVLKLLLSKYAPLSVEMESAIVKDQAVIDNKGNPNYIDNPNKSIPYNQTKNISDQCKNQDTVDISKLNDEELDELFKVQQNNNGE